MATLLRVWHEDEDDEFEPLCANFTERSAFLNFIA